MVHSPPSFLLFKISPAHHQKSALASPLFFDHQYSHHDSTVPLVWITTPHHGLIERFGGGVRYTAREASRVGEWLYIAQIEFRNKKSHSYELNWRFVTLLPLVPRLSCLLECENRGMVLWYLFFFWGLACFELTPTRVTKLISTNHVPSSLLSKL